MHLQRIAARTALAALIMGVCGAGAALAGLRLGHLSDQTATQVIFPAVGLGVLALVAALVWLALALKRNEGAGKRPGLIALLGALAFLYFPLMYVYYGLVSLPINDATTDPEDPPAFVALAKIPSANARAYDGQRRIAYSGPDARYKGTDVTVAYAFHDRYPLLTKPHSGLLVTPQKAFWRAYETVKRLGWTIVDASEKDLRIEATDTSFWFGRTSDIVIRVRQAGKIGSRIDIRSQSREAGWDHGRNAARLKTFFGAFHF